MRRFVLTYKVTYKDLALVQDFFVLFNIYKKKLR